MIKYYSTNLNYKPVTFKEALLQGLAPDKGLFMPEKIPTISREELISLKNLEYPEIAAKILYKFLDGEISYENLLSLSKDAYNFEIPLENVIDRKYILRLDRGPTASFKDFAARMMGRLMQYFLQQENKNLVILTATSGDTGSAVANAFYNLENIKVVILYPEKEITARQRKQMTTLHKNINIIALKGKFDDCQALVKKAFVDNDLSHLNLSSANSINIGRLLPQSIYYIYSYLKLSKNIEEEVIFSVPCGNFGNLMGGLIAKFMGIPVKKFIVATNENDEVPNYFITGKYSIIQPSKNCISSAMNVGHPSNMARVIALYGGIMNEKGEILKEPQFAQMKKDMFAISINDNDTRKTIIEAYKKFNLLLEPHGAVAWAGLLEYLKNYNEDDEKLMISLETAHPSKFPEEIKNLLGFEPELADSLKGLDEKEEKYMVLDNNYSILKEYLLNNF